SFVQQDKTTHRLTIGGAVEGSEINIANSKKEDRTLSGVKKAERMNEAVNKGQLDESLEKFSNSLQSDDSAVVHYDKKEGDNNTINYASVTLGKGKDKAAVGLHNVADGQIAKDSRDAITGGQVNKIGEDVAKFLGGEASFKEGVFTAPTYKISNVSDDGTVTTNSYNDVGSAFAGLDTSVKNVNTHLSNEVKKFDEKLSNITQAVQGDALLWGKTKGAFVATHGDNKENSKLTSLAAGSIVSGSSDAITGGQIYDLQKQFATYFGGGAGYNEKGEWVAPTFKLKTVNSDGSAGEEKVYNSVSEAFAGVASSITNVHNDVTNVISDSLIKQDDDTKVITIGKEAEGTELNIANSKKEERTLSGVKAGVLSAESTEVVNGSQLFATNKNVTTVSTNLDSVSKNTSSYLGGGADVLVGNLPTYVVGGQSYHDVGSAFSGVDTSLTDLHNELSKNSNELTQTIEQNALLWNDEANAFVARHVKNKEKDGQVIAEQENSKLKFLLDGEISKGSTEAITGNQLYSMNQTFAEYFGGGAGYDKDGKWKAPSFVIKKVDAEGKESEESYKSVAEAFAGVASSITNVHNDITNVVSESLVKQDNETAPITVGKETNGTVINVANKNGVKRVISGVEDAKDNNDAVNKGQLDASLKELSTSLQSEDSAVVHYDKKEGDNGGIDYTSVTLGKGKDKAAVGLHNVADGQITKGSHDAITGGQINKIGEDVAKFLGGEASFKDGALTQPRYKLSHISEDGQVSTSAFDGVGGAFEGLDDNIKNVNQRIKEVSEGVAQDSLNWSNEAKAFVAKHGTEGSNSKITFLANGEITAKSTDAVTGGQLYSMNQTFATYFGGGAGYNEKGEWVAPTFKLKTVKDDGSTGEESYKSVAEALSDISSSVTNVHHDVTNVVSDSLVKQDEKTKVIAVGKEVAGTELNIANKDKGDRILSGVKAATKNNEAVNKGQLDESLKNLSTSLQSDESAVVHYDKKEGDNGGIDYTSVTLGKGKDAGPVALHNVKDGAIGESSHDAINGSQINTISQNVAKFLGGGAAFKDGVFTGPTYSLSKVDAAGNITNGSFDNVGSAFTGLDENIKNVNARIKEVSEGVAQDSLNWSNEANAFVARHEKKQEEKGRAVRTQENSRITFLANGEISAKSTDAVTGNQLYSMNQTFATYFGGGAGYNEKGEWVAPTFKLKTVKDDGSTGEESYKSVAEALSDISSSITNVHNDVTNVVSDSLIKQDDDTKVITIGKEVAGTEISLLDEKGKERTLSGVKAAENDNEAVNKAQLDASLKDLSTSLQSDDSAVVHYDKLADGKTDYSSVTLGKGKDAGPVALHNVADGTIAENSHDAINGSQIHTISQNVAKILGGDAAFKDGSFTNPTYKLSHVSEEGKVTDGSYNDVGSAFTGLDKNIKNVNQRIKEVSESVAQDSLNWSEADSAFVALHGEGKGKSNSKLKFLLDGDVFKGSTEAITGNQLYSMGSALATYFGGGAKYEKGEWVAPTFKLKTVNGDGTEIEKSYQSVADAFAGVASSITNVHNDVTNVVSDSLVKQDNETAPITVGKETSGTEINIANKDQADRTLSGVKAATKNNEAVNKGQLDESLKELSNNLQSDESAVIHYDKKEKGETDYTNVTLGKGKDSSSVSLHNVADGKIIKDSHDAITGGQINKIGEDIAKFLGGEASFKDGSFTNPTYKLSHVSEEGKVTDGSYNDVGSAFTGLDKNIKNVNQRIKEVSEGVAQDSLNWSEADSAFVAKHGEKKTNSKITSLQNGDITATSSDAIAGNQLHSLGSSVAAYFGGNASYENGTWKAPNFVIKKVDAEGKESEKSYNSVAEALSDISTSVTNVHNDVTNVVSDSLVKQDKEGAPITIGKETGGTIINLQNKSNENRTISGVIGGTISKDSIEAINGSQLFETNDKVATYFGGGAKYENGTWSAPTFKVKSVNSDGQEKDETYQNVADALTDVGSSITNVKNDITKKINNEIANVKGDSLIKKEEKTNLITIGKEVEGVEINIANKDKGDRTLSGLKAATKNNEAVNKGQLDESLKELSNNLQSDDSAVIHYDKKEKGEIDYTNITLGKGKGSTSVGLHNVADGVISESSHDAVTGGQINKIGKDIAKFLGGESSFKNGVLTQPTYKLSEVSEEGKVKDKSYTGVGTAFSGLNENIKHVNQRIKEVSEGVAQDSLNWSSAEGAFLAQHGEKEGTKTNSKIKFLANGEVTESSSDAIAGNQLHALGDSVAKTLGGNASYENGKWTNPTFKFKSVNEDGSKVEDKDYSTVAEAFAGVGTSFENLQKEFTQSNTEVTENIKQNALLWSDEDSAFVATHGDAKGSSKIKFLAAGNIAEDSTEAVNGSQLFATNKSVATYLGGSASYENGTWTAPTFTVKSVNEDGATEDKDYHDVASAFVGVGTSFTNVNNSITNIHNELKNEINKVVGDSLVKQDSETKVIKIGAETEGSTITISNSNGDTRSIFGVKAATLSEGSTEAVNGSQLYSLNKTLATYFGGGASYENGAWTAPTFKVTTFNESGNAEEHSYANIADAFAGVSSSFTKLHNDITDNIEQNALLWSDEDSAFVALHGQGDTRSKSKLKLLLDGDISEGS
ncbi:hypothetical protein, partial [Bartonella sp. AP58NXGY]|uniref:hypothetical protein n=1 Tax=Bartonella sp. AP58NXGY TaxID=3243498 RepID=UPI0035D11155